MVEAKDLTPCEHHGEETHCHINPSDDGYCNAEAVVLDPGSGYMKCGVADAGEDDIKMFCNVIGRPRSQAADVFNGADKTYVGDECLKNDGICNLTYAITDGLVSDWEAFRICIEHAIVTELRVPPSDYHFLLTEAPSNAKENRAKMFEHLLDFGCAAVQCQVQAVLALFASGRTGGMVLDSGDGVSHCVPVIDGMGMRNWVAATKLAGRKFSLEVVRLLNKNDGTDFTSLPNKVELGKAIKEGVCRIALDYDEELAAIEADSSLHKEYELPDGSVVTLGRTTIEAGEVLMQPELISGDVVDSLPTMIKKAIDNCNINSRETVFKGNVLSGGTTCTPGFEERIRKEYKAVVPQAKRNEVKIESPADRKLSVFYGGAILAKLSSFSEKWITQCEYQEFGSAIFERSDKRLF